MEVTEEKDYCAIAEDFTDETVVADELELSGGWGAVVEDEPGFELFGNDTTGLCQ